MISRYLLSWLREYFFTKKHFIRRFEKYEMHGLPQSAFDTWGLPLYDFLSLIVISYQNKSSGQIKSKEEYR